MENINNNGKLNLDNEIFTIRDGQLIQIKKILPKIVIPEGVDSIFNHLFTRMSADEKSKMVEEEKKIEEVVFPSTLQEIYSGAFSLRWGHYCFFDLKNIKLPPSLKHIGANAFSENSNIETIELYDNAEINYGAFLLDREVIRPNPYLPNALKPKHSTVLVHNLPKKIIINYSSFQTLSKLLDGLINAGHFHFSIMHIPKFEFELKGPKLSKLETLKIYRKMIVTRARKFHFTNQEISLELPNNQLYNTNQEEKDGRTR